MSIREQKPFPLFEWCTSIMVILMAFTLAIDPHTIEKSSFRLLLDLGIPPIVFMLVAAFTGSIRIFALVWNGRVWYSAQMRAIGIAISAVIWGQLCMALVLRTFETGSISLGISIYGVLTGGELFALYRVFKESKLITLLMIERDYVRRN